jgi:hypothetical protein
MRSSNQSGLRSATDSGPSGALRRRRNELEYPHLPAASASADEAAQAAEIAQRLIDAASKLLPQVSFFSQDQEVAGMGDNHVLTADGSRMLVPNGSL